MSNESKPLIKRFMQWEMTILQFSLATGIILAMIYFVFGNTLGRAVADDSVSLVEEVLYFLKVTIELFLLASVLNFIFHLVCWIVLFIRNEET